MRGLDSSSPPGMAMARTGQERIVGTLTILIPFLYCPLPNGDNDTLINTGPSIPIIGKWYPHNKWDSYCFFSQPLTKTNPAGPKFDHGQYWVLWGYSGKSLIKAFWRLWWLEVLWPGAVLWPVLCSTGVQWWGWVAGAGVLRVARMEHSDTVSPSVCRKSPAITHLT